MAELGMVIRSLMGALAILMTAADTYTTADALWDMFQHLSDLTRRQQAALVGLLTLNTVDVVITGFVVYTLYAANWDFLRTMAPWYGALHVLLLVVPILHIYRAAKEGIEELKKMDVLLAIFITLVLAGFVIENIFDVAISGFVIYTLYAVSDWRPSAWRSTSGCSWQREANAATTTVASLQQPTSPAELLHSVNCYSFSVYHL